MSERENANITEYLGKSAFTMICLIKNRWRFLLMAGLAGFLLSVLFYMTLPKVYVSKGFFSLNLQVEGYKRLMKRMANARLMQTEAQTDGYTAGQNRGKIRYDQDGLEKAIQPVYALTRNDVRNLPAIMAKEESNTMLGVNLTASSDTPEKARAMVTSLGEMLRDQLMLDVLIDHINVMKTQYVNGLMMIQNELEETEFMLEQLRTKLGVIRSLIGKYPNSNALANRQVIDIRDVGYRYLSPAAQAVGIESEIADLVQKMGMLRRKKDMYRIFSLVYAELFEKMNGMFSGQTLFKEFSRVIDGLGEREELNGDLKSTIINNMAIEKQKFISLFYDKSQFFSDPTLPERPVQPKMRTVVFGLTFLILMLALVFAFLWEQVKWGRMK